MTKAQLIRFAYMFLIPLLAASSAIADPWEDAQEYYLETQEIFNYQEMDWGESNNLLYAYEVWRSEIVIEAYEMYYRNEIDYTTLDEILDLSQDSINRMTYIAEVLNSDNTPPVWSVREKLDDAENELFAAFGALYTETPSLTIVYSECDKCRSNCDLTNSVMEDLLLIDFTYVSDKIDEMESLLVPNVP